MAKKLIGSMGGVVAIGAAVYLLAINGGNEEPKGDISVASIQQSTPAQPEQSSSEVVQADLDSLEPGEPMIERIQSIDDLVAFLNSFDAELLDADKVMAFLSSDPSALAAVVDWFEANLSGENREKLLQVLSDEKSEVMIDLSERLSESAHTENRIQAYKWLGPLGLVNNRARETMLNASYKEDSVDALKELTTSLATSFDDEESAYDTREATFNRISEFAENAEDVELARVALKEVTDRYQSPESLSLIKKHLSREDTETKLNALAGLKNFYDADEDTRELLDTMMADPYEDPEVKAMIESVYYRFDVENKQ